MGTEWGLHTEGPGEAAPGGRAGPGSSGRCEPASGRSRRKSEARGSTPRTMRGRQQCRLLFWEPGGSQAKPGRRSPATKAGGSAVGFLCSAWGRHQRPAVRLSGCPSVPSHVRGQPRLPGSAPPGRGQQRVPAPHSLRQAGSIQQRPPHRGDPDPELGGGLREHRDAPLFILPPCPLAPRPPLPWLRRGSAPHGGRPAEPSPAPHPRPGRPPCGAWAGLGLTPAPPARGWGQSRFPAPSAPSPLPESTGGAPGPAAVPPSLRAPGRAQHPQDGGAELRGLWQPLCHPAAAGNNGLSSGTAALGCHDPCFVAASVPGAERGAAASGLAQKEGVRVNAPPGGVTPGASSTMASPICSPKQAIAAFRVRKCTLKLRLSPRSRLVSFPKFHKSLVVHLIIHKVEILPGKRDPFASESSGKEQGISPSRATPSCGPHFQGTAPNYPVPG